MLRRCTTEAGSKADFFRRERVASFRVGTNQRRDRSGSRRMTFAGRMSVVTAYIALAFVGAIVLGVF
jgi:hypothetical protein